MKCDGQTTRIIVLLLCVIAFAAGVSPVSGDQGGATRCTSKNCEVTITLQVAFVGADWDYIDRFVTEVEREWNGPESNPSTCGDCKCPFRVQVITKKVDRCSEATGGFHCIEVTKYSEKPPYSANDTIIEKVKAGEIDPKTSGLVTRHRGYMQPPGVSTGDPLKGWWSDIMSTPVDGKKALDFAHEAGHMMGLDDGDGGIMNQSGVVGGGAGVTQANIDSVVQKICGDAACPDRCCCGNGKIDGGKGEACDPLATPCGCGSGTACCPVCCNCYGPCCDPSSGEYASEGACTQNCTGPDEVCAYNYYTGCWDCVEKWAVEFSDQYAGTKESLWKANESAFHPVNRTSSKGSTIETALRRIETNPHAASLFANERIDIHIEHEAWHALTAGGRVVAFGEGPVDRPTVRMYCDEDTFDEIERGDLDFWTAFEEGRIEWEGVGILNAIKFGIAELIFDIFSF